jgi:hypothetical protein
MRVKKAEPSLDPAFCHPIDLILSCHHHVGPTPAGAEERAGV